MKDASNASRNLVSNDNRQKRAEEAELDGAKVRIKAGLVSDVVMTLRFYSRLPSGASPHEKPDLNRIARALPFASLLIGLPSSAILLAGAWAGLPMLYCAVIAVGANAVVTGAMAEDAIGDSADGLGGGADVERRLEILRDSRLGSYGVTAVVLYLAARIAAYSAFAAANPFGAAALLLAAGMIARSASLWLALRLPAARADGASATAGRPAAAPFWLGLGIASLLFVILAGPKVGIGGLALAAALMVGTALVWQRLCRRLVGGQTGDLIGGLQALLEIAALSAFIVFAGR